MNRNVVYTALPEECFEPACRVAQSEASFLFKNPRKNMLGQYASIRQRASVANRPKFLPQNAKVAPEKSLRPRKSAAQFYADFPKNGRKGAELFDVCFLLKIL
jgi:hypothetical protein